MTPCARLRMRQRRTLREVSATARVSLGYLSEVERGQKEPSSELLAAICGALDVELSELFTEVARRICAARRSSPSPAAIAAGPGRGIPARITPGTGRARSRRHRPGARAADRRCLIRRFRVTPVTSVTGSATRRAPSASQRRGVGTLRTARPDRRA